MKTRGLGRIYQPKYRDRATREVRTSPTLWIQYSYRGGEVPRILKLDAPQ